MRATVVKATINTGPKPAKLIQVMAEVVTNTPISDEEISQVASLLSRFEPGFLPLPIFLEITRLTVASIVELVPLSLNNGKVEVFLIQREDSDQLWPGEWHNPGTVVRATDTPGSYTDALQRIFRDELNTQYHEPTFVAPLLHKTRRGSESARIYWVELDQTPPAGQYFPINALPADTIQSHRKVAELAAHNFLQVKELL